MVGDNLDRPRNSEAHAHTCGDGWLRSYTVTKSASRARHIYLLGSQPGGYRWLKIRAHRLDRREWRQYLHVWAIVGGDEQAEGRLGIPHATDSDVI